MATDKVPNIQVIEKPDWVSWEDVREVIWLSHSRNREEGMNMLFPSLSGEEIRKRVEERKGKMFVALDGKEVVGTGALTVKRVDLWCGRGEYAYLCFAAVLPEYNGQGLYKALCALREEESRRMGLDRMMFDSHENNKVLFGINKKNGFYPVSYKNYGDHNNVIMVKWLAGSPYSYSRCKYEFFRRKVSVKVRQLVKTFFRH